MPSGSGREERESLRRTFDAAAHHYHEARPDYPADLFDDLVRLARLAPRARVLEIGAGTGKATVPMAQRDFQIVSLELGTRLAGEAAQNLSGFPDVEVVAASFDDWERGQRPPFDLVFAATAWHWLDPATRYTRAWEALRPGGHVAFWSASHVFPEGGDPFFRDIQAVYEEIGEGVSPDATWPRPGELPDERDEIEATGLFTDVQVRHHDWEVRYDAESYVALLRTFSGHLAMAEWKQRRLYDAIRTRLAVREDGVLRRHWGVALHVATRAD
ncbi:MAG: class I SAM-dependent methyltransferase [Nocardioidaceae bacterium]